MNYFNMHDMMWAGRAVAVEADSRQRPNGPLDLHVLVQVPIYVPVCTSPSLSSSPCAHGHAICVPTYVCSKRKCHIINPIKTEKVCRTVVAYIRGESGKIFLKTDVDLGPGLIRILFHA